MSHDININDAQEGTFMAWHKLTKLRQQIAIDDCWLSTWDVQKSPLHRADGSLSDWKEIVCTDDNSLVIGPPVADSYSLITNKEFLEIVRDSMEHIRDSRIVSNGSVCDRGRVFVSVEIPEFKEFEAANRHFTAYINFLNSHDMSCPFVVNASNTCTVCNNTFTMNLTDTNNKAFRASVRHTKNAHAKLADIDGMIDAYVGTQARFRVTMNALAKKAADAYQASQFFAGLLSTKDNRQAAKMVNSIVDVESSTRRSNQVSRLTELFKSGKGNRGETRADIFSAVTDYYSHESSGGRNVFKQVASSDFGAGQAMKDRALSALDNDDDYHTLTRVGKLVLA